MRLVPPGLHFGDGTNGPGKLCGLLQGLVEGRYCFFFWFGGFLQVPNLWFLKWLYLGHKKVRCTLYFALHMGAWTLIG